MVKCHVSLLNTFKNLLTISITNVAYFADIENMLVNSIIHSQKSYIN